MLNEMIRNGWKYQNGWNGQNGWIFGIFLSEDLVPKFANINLLKKIALGDISPMKRTLWHMSYYRDPKRT